MMPVDLLCIILSRCVDLSVPSCCSSSSSSISSSCSRLMSGVSTLMMDLFRSLKASFTCLGCTWKHRDKRSTLDHVIHSMRVVTLQNIICHFAISLVAHLVTAVHARHALRQADHALQLSHRYPPGGLGHASGAVTLTQTLVLLHDELFRFAGDLQNREGPAVNTDHKSASLMWTQNLRRWTRTLGLNCLAKSRYLRISSRVYSLSTDSSMRECRSTMRLAMA